MDESKSPVFEAVSELFATSKLRRIPRILVAPKWHEFFITAYGVGLSLSIFSMILVMSLYYILQISTAKGPISILSELLSNLAPLVLGIWLLSIYLSAAVNATVEPEIPFEGRLETAVEYFEDYRGNLWFDFLGFSLRALVLALSIAVLSVYRNVLILNYPVVSGWTDFTGIVYWILVFTLDLGFIGLFLTTFSHTYGLLHSVAFPEDDR